MSPSMTGTRSLTATTVVRSSSIVCIATDGAHRPFGAALRDESAGRVDVRVLDRVQHLVERDVPRRHARRVELNLELTQVAAEPLDGGDAGHGEQAVLELELGEVAQRHQVDGAGFRFERELQDLVQAAGQARQQRRVGARRQLRRHLTDALGDELPRAVVVGVGLELDRHLADAELRRRANAPDVWKPGERRLQRNGDRGLQLLRAHRRVLDDDVEDRRRQIRKHVAPKLLRS